MHAPFGRSSLFALSLSLLATFTVPAYAADAVTGRVVDPDGRPVAGARVLVSGDGMSLLSGTTGGDGRFTIPASDDARVRVRVAADGFRAEPLDVEPAPASRDVGTITLALSALSESVVVSAAQIDVPFTEVASSVTVVSGDEIESRQSHSIADVLRTIPGLTAVGTGGTGATTGIFPRGGESNYTLVLIDGVPANAFGGDFDFGHLSSSNVERVEIVRGPQSALFGSNAIGAVVRVVTRRGGPPTAQLTAEIGQHGTSRIGASTAGSRGRFEWGALADRLLSDGMNGDRTAAGETVVNDDYDRRTAGISGGWRAGGASLRADVRHSTDERGFPGPFGTNPIGAYGGIDAVSRGENARSHAGASAALPVSSRVQARAEAGYNRIESDFRSPFDSSEAFSRRWTGRLQTDVALGAGADLSAGVELQRERAGSTYITGSAFEQIPVRRTTAGYFGEARWKSRDRFFAAAGVRGEAIRRDGLPASSARPVLPADSMRSVNPRISAAWLPRAAGAAYTKLRAAAGTGIRPPDAFELAFTDNPGLRPERSLSAEGGVDHAFASGHALLEATAFFNEYDDLIIAVGPFTGSSRYRTDNIANARARGLELALTLRGRVPGRRIDLSGRIGYTRLATEVLPIDDGSAAPPPFLVGQPLIRRPKHQLSADILVSASRLSAFVQGGGRSGVLDVEPSLGTFGGLFEAAGYRVWNAGLSWRVFRLAQIVGRVENLFNRPYEEALGFPAPGRRATVGIRIAAGR